MADETNGAPDVETVQLAAPEDGAPQTGDTNDTDAPLNDGGMKALESERRARRLAEKELKALRDVEQKRADAEKSELQKAVERAERAEKLASDAERRAFAAAQGIPADLLTGATPDDWQASADALKAFQQAAAPQRQVAPRAEGVQGNTGTPVTTSAGQLTGDDVKRMYAAKDYDGINKARTEGRLNNILGAN